MYHFLFSGKWYIISGTWLDFAEMQNAKCKMQNFGASPIILHRFKHCRGNSRIARIGITHKLPQNQLKQLAPLVRGAVFCEAKRLRGSYIFKLSCISPSVIFFENATFLVRGRQRLIYNLSVANLAILLSSPSISEVVQNGNAWNYKKNLHHRDSSLCSRMTRWFFCDTFGNVTDKL